MSKNLKEDYYKIKIINELKKDGLLLEYITNRDRDILEVAINQNSKAFNFIKDPSEEIKELFKKVEKEEIRQYEIALVKKHYPNIENIENPSEELQKIAYEIYPRSIQYIKNPCFELEKHFINSDYSNLQYLQNPSKEIIEMLLNDDHGRWMCFKYLKEGVSDDIKLEIIKHRPFRINDIKNPTLEMQLKAYELDKTLLKNMKVASIDFYKEILKNDPYLISNFIGKHKIFPYSITRKFEDKLEEFKKIAVTNDARSIQFIENPSLEIQLIAVKNAKNLYDARTFIRMSLDKDAHGLYKQLWEDSDSDSE